MRARESYVLWGVLSPRRRRGHEVARVGSRASSLFFTVLLLALSTVLDVPIMSGGERLERHGPKLAMAVKNLQTGAVKPSDGKPVGQMLVPRHVFADMVRDGGAALLQRRSQDDVPDDLSAVSSLKDDDQAGSNSRKRKPHPLSPIPSAPVVESDDEEPAEPSPKKKKTPKKSPPKRKSLGRAAKKSS